MDTTIKTKIQFKGVNGSKKRSSVMITETDELKDMYIALTTNNMGDEVSEDEETDIVFQIDKSNGSFWIQGREMPKETIEDIIRFLI